MDWNKYAVQTMNLEKRQKEKAEKMKEECVDKLKGLANGVLGYFGMSTDNFKSTQNPDGTYSLAFQN